jgi:SH3 domain protein
MKNIKRNPAFLHLFVLACFLIISSGNAYADRRFVSDKLIITLRSAKGSGSKICTLKSGNPVDVIEKSGRYLKVRTTNGKEGWVASQYISSKTPKSKVIKELKSQIASLNKAIEHENKEPKDTIIAKLRKKNSALTEAAERFEKKIDRLAGELKKTKKKHNKKIEKIRIEANNKKDISSNKDSALKQITEKYNRLLEESKNYQNLINENSNLNVKIQALKKEVRQLQKKISASKFKGMLFWFLAGAGVFFTGILAGLLFKKRKYYIDI